MNRIWDPTERSKHPVEIEEQPGRPWVAVTGLADGTRVEEPSPFEVHLRSSGGNATLDPTVAQRDRECDVAVSNEDERGRGKLERGLHGLLGQHVLPDGIPRARVEEVNPFDLAGGLQALEKPARVLGEDLRGPDRRCGRFVVEVADVEPAQGDEIVVPDEAGVGALPDFVATLVRQGPVPDDVSETPDGIDALRVDLFKDRLECVVVSVNV